MAFRFRKIFTIFPGLRLNIAKKSVSISAGRDGATLNIGKDGVRGTVGLPGSGLSYSKILVPRRKIEEALGGPDGAEAKPTPARPLPAPEVTPTPEAAQAPPGPQVPQTPPAPPAGEPAGAHARRFGGRYSPPPPAPVAPPPLPPKD